MHVCTFYPLAAMNSSKTLFGLFIMTVFVKHQDFSRFQITDRLVNIGVCLIAVSVKRESTVYFVNYLPPLSLLTLLSFT